MSAEKWIMFKCICIVRPIQSHSKEEGKEKKNTARITHVIFLNPFPLASATLNSRNAIKRLIVVPNSKFYLKIHHFSRLSLFFHDSEICMEGFQSPGLPKILFLLLMFILHIKISSFALFLVLKCWIEFAPQLRVQVLLLQQYLTIYKWYLQAPNVPGLILLIVPISCLFFSISTAHQMPCVCLF